MEASIHKSKISKKLRERKNVRISLNKLGEYIEASPLRRQSIVRDQKFPKGFITNFYSEAREAITQFFLNDKDSSIIYHEISNLQNKITTSDYSERDRKASITLLQVFLQINHTLDTSTFSFSRGIPKNGTLIITDVIVSVQPEIIIRKRDTDEIVGAIKFATSKSKPLNDDTAKYITTTIQQYIEEKLLNNGDKIKNNKCLLIDIHQKKIHYAPKSFKKRRNQVKSACEEINLWWKAIIK